ncbi:glycerol kinase GlpK [Rhodoblastus acidophilus]|uniref:Glycerol kinase n=1 Tax=Candidatus Rhodoblastus alkanivorans TaxID=2954117 RepID=A0ABS9Z3L9_9HYPH|nr:glycerol kinase GlpK [Candidatus Rhodoblastus alkanivorans]MCI4680208.1 glycerol kinase GlpK [Candidatus Rhodoblastus alkanivorans]MCI4682270.1 glycerol kinase GlpK [Candidatus Rhodoblastus alkanivorans]MDI4639572.1 glycerol kinase GlpK [Rhodoblastus acidophilus]
MTRYVGAIDQGTTSTRFLVFDRAGAIVAGAQKEHRQIFPQPGWVEHDAEEIFRATCEVIGEALAGASLSPSDLAAVGIANQRETALIWERDTGRPLHNALVWMDTRTEALVAEMSRDGGADRFRAKTGLPLTTYFSALKWRWLLDCLPEARRRAEAGEVLFGTMDSWLVWRLTGRHVTDVTNASRTLLMNLTTLDWDDSLLAAFELPRAALPEIRSSSEIFGGAMGPLTGVPLAGLLGDQQAALFGQACLRPGQAKNTYGTGCFLLMNSGETPFPSRAGLLTTLGYKLGEAKPVYALEGSVAIAGALVQWLRDNLGLIRSASEIEALAASAPDNGDVYIVPAFSGLYAPHWRSNARGIIAGLTRFADRRHLARAALEATAYQTRDVLDVMIRESGVAMQEMRVDGGMVVNDLLMQFQSDILGAPVVRPKIVETTALGAAYAAGLAVGYWRSTGDIEENWAADRRWSPRMDEGLREKLYTSWGKAVRRSFDWVE